MGVNISELFQVQDVKLTDLSNRIIGIDGHNVSYQFLARIRNSETGDPLRDQQGRVTSHLSGIFYRTSSLVEAGIKPLFVWDGTPPKLKEKTIRERRAVRELAEKRWIEALGRGEEVMVYAQSASKLTSVMIDESIELLDYMGIPSIKAPSEGEAQLARMAFEGDIWASASQDWDSLLFNSPRLVRNLSITGQRKLPHKHVFVEIKPELVELNRNLANLEITREQLIILGILVGTDYNSGIKGIGPKTALHLVKEYKTLDRVLQHVEGIVGDVDQIFNFFLNPPTTKVYEIKWKEPNKEKLIEFMVEKRNFSRIRVEKVLKSLYDHLVVTRSLDSYFL